MAADTSNASASDLVGWMASPETRGTLTLVWSCVLTIFACTWTVLHLNVPGRDESPLTVLLRKIKWMAINILFPEFIFAKAVCELRLALEELREFDEHVHENENIVGRWTSSDGSDAHEWSWEFEYPLWAHTLYQLLQLTPPQTDVKQKQLPLWIPKTVRSQFAAPKSRRQSDAEAHHSANLDGPGQSISQAIPSTPEVTSTPQDLHITSSIEHKEAGEGQNPKELLTVKYRTVQKWTVVHSYYAQMGGILYQRFTSSDSRPHEYCFTASMLTKRYTLDDDKCRKNLFEHLILGEQDIKDKSKADWVLKGIAIAQVAWLILSVIVRSILDLPITQLEIATISFAVMAILSYAANWWKPKDISHATILQTPARGSPSSQVKARSFMLRLWSSEKAAGSATLINDCLRRVPIDLVWMKGDSPFIFILMAISSLGFGGLHCLAWHFEFPSSTELLLWRVSSVISAVLPVISLGISLGLHFLATTYTNFKLVSTLLRKLEPLNGLQTDIWEHIENPEWCSWRKEAKLFLLRNPTGSRDWENERSPEETLSQAESEDDEVLYPRLLWFHIDLTHFTLKYWGKADKRLHTRPVICTRIGSFALLSCTTALNITKCSTFGKNMKPLSGENTTSPCRIYRTLPASPSYFEPMPKLWTKVGGGNDFGDCARR